MHSVDPPWGCEAGGSFFAFFLFFSNGWWEVGSGREVRLMGEAAWWLGGEAKKMGDRKEREGGWWIFGYGGDSGGFLVEGAADYEGERVTKGPRRKSERRGKRRWKRAAGVEKKGVVSALLSSKDKLSRGRRSGGMVSIQLDLFAFIPFCYDFWDY